MRHELEFKNGEFYESILRKYSEILFDNGHGAYLSSASWYSRRCFTKSPETLYHLIVMKKLGDKEKTVPCNSCYSCPKKKICCVEGWDDWGNNRESEKEISFLKIEEVMDWLDKIKSIPLGVG